MVEANNISKGDSLKAITHRLWWQLAVLLMVSAVAVYVSLSFNEGAQGFLPEAVVMPSVFNKKPSGLSGLSEIARQAGLSCQPWQSTYRELKSVQGLLCVVSPLESFNKVEEEQILDWVRKGNSLIFLDRFDTVEGQRFLKKLGLKFKTGKKISEKEITPSPQADNCAYVRHLVLSAQTRLAGGKPIAEDSDGSLITEVAYGKGHAIIGTTTALCANRLLKTPASFDNFQLLVNWLATANGSVFFDERCHGFSNSTNIFIFLLGEPPGFVFLQLILILVVLFLSSFQRFGGAKTYFKKREISSLQFIDGLANAYERAKAGLAALEIIVQDFKTKLCKELGLSSQSSAEDVALAWRGRIGGDGRNLLDFLTNYERALREKKISTVDLKKYVLKCDELAHQFEGQSRRKRQRF
jgi:hypothetical protein